MISPGAIQARISPQPAAASPPRRSYSFSFLRSARADRLPARRCRDIGWRATVFVDAAFRRAFTEACAHDFAASKGMSPSGRQRPTSGAATTAPTNGSAGSSVRIRSDIDARLSPHCRACSLATATLAQLGDDSTGARLAVSRLTTSIAKAMISSMPLAAMPEQR